MIQSYFEKEGLDWDAGTSGITIHSGLLYFPLATVKQLILGNFDHSPAQEPYKETVVLNIFPSR